MRRNQFLLIQILLLDIIGFSILFPLMPQLITFYMEQAAHNRIDAWLLPLIDWLKSLLPIDRQADSDLIILLGGVIASVYSLLQFLLAPFWGRLSDRIGRRPVLVATSIGLALSYLLWAFSPSFTLFMLSRILGGIMAGNMGVASAAMADMTEIKDRTKAMGLLGAAFGVGFVIGPALGGVAALLDLTLYFPEASYLHPLSFCALLSFGLSLFSAVRNLFSFKETLSVADRESAAAAASAVMATTTAAGRSHFMVRPLGSLKLVRDIPGFGRLVLVYFLYLLMFSGFEFSLSFFFKLDFGLTPLEIGMIFFYMGIILVLGQGGLVRLLSGRVEERHMAQVGLLLIPLALLGLALTAPSVALAMLALAPIAIGAALVQPALNALGSILAPSDQQGHALGVLRSWGALARAIGPIGGAYIYWISGATNAYLLLSAAMVLTLFLSIGLRKRDLNRHN